MKRALWFGFLCFCAWSLNARASNSVSETYTNGADTVSAHATVTFNSYDPASGFWHYTVGVQLDSWTNSSGNASGGFGVGVSGLGPSNTTGSANTGLCLPGTTFTNGLSVTAGINGAGGTNYADVISPLVPAKTKAVTVKGVNTFPTSGVLVEYDITAGAYIQNSAVPVGAGAPFAYQVTSNGDDIDLRFVSQTLAQWNADSSDGTGAWVSGDLVSGSDSAAAGLLTIPYATMNDVSQNGSTDPSNPSTQTLTTPAVDVSGGGIISNGNPNQSSVTGQGTDNNLINAIFNSGTASNQTGNTSDLTNGQFNQGVNGEVQATAEGDTAIIAAIRGISLSGGSSSFPSSIAVTIPSGITVNFPSSLAVAFPSNYPDSAAIAALALLNSTATDIDGQLMTATANNAAIKSDLDTLKSVFSPSSVYDPSGAESSAEAAGAGIVSGNAWGAGIAPATRGAVGNVNMPASLPSDLAGPALPSGFVVPNLSFNPGGQLWAGADTILRSGRSFLALAMSAIFIASCGKAMSIYAANINNADMSGPGVSIENLAPGIAQAKHVLACTAATVVVATAISAMLLVVTNSLSASGVAYTVANITNAVDFSALGSGVAVLDQYIPCALLVSFALLRSALHFWIAPIYLAATTLLRFLTI